MGSFRGVTGAGGDDNVDVVDVEDEFVLCSVLGARNFAVDDVDCCSCCLCCEKTKDVPTVANGMEDVIGGGSRETISAQASSSFVTSTSEDDDDLDSLVSMFFWS